MASINLVLIKLYTRVIIIVNNNSDDQYQMRNIKSASVSLSSREILANALETTAKTGEELSRLRAYKEGVESLNEDAARLANIKKKIKEIYFTKGSDRTQLVKLNNSNKSYLPKSRQMRGSYYVHYTILVSHY